MVSDWRIRDFLRTKFIFFSRISILQPFISFPLSCLSIQEEIRSKNSQLESELSAAKKDRDGLQREKKQTSASKNTLELRLNRALEEVEKHKGSLKSSRESSAVMNNTDRKRMEQLQTENKKLEKQKTELITAFKKQMKLIDILKRQKMHIEAAKLLEFSEEEFVRALEWGKPWPKSLSWVKKILLEWGKPWPKPYVWVKKILMCIFHKGTGVGKTMTKTLKLGEENFNVYFS